MSFYSDASLVMIPSGYKTSKVYSAVPTDGAGDLSFTRTADTATRVGPDGLIEKVRTNLVLQSNTFSTTWTNTNTTETGGQAGYDGTNNAWLLESTSASGHIVQAISASGLQTYSVYAKAGTLNWIRILITASTGNEDRYFNLASGTIGGTTYGPLNSTITSEGNGWYRCSIVYNESTTGVRVYPASADLDTSGLGNILIQDAQLEAGDIATEPILTTSAAVSVGPVANVPRLDYTNSSCPRLLLEPQATALNQFSESFDNAYWTKNAATIVANHATSPDGYQNADLLYPASAGVSRYVLKFVGATSGLAYTTSVFAKASGKNWLGMANVDSGSTTAWFNLSTGTVGTVLSGTTATITDYGNGWYRCTVTRTAAATTGAIVLLVEDADNSDNITPNGTDGILLYGCNFTQSAYATSYIPTLGAAVTRGKDSAVKSGISSIIGQTEGVIFADVVLSTASQQIAILTSAAGNEANRVQVYGDGTGKIGFLRGDGTAIILSSSTYAIGTRLKIAAAYKANDFVLYINGVLQGSDTSVTAPVSPAVLYWGQYVDGSGFSDLKYNQFLLFPTRLSNADLAALTA